MDCNDGNESKNESEEVGCTRIAFQNFRILTEMESAVAGGRKWEEMECDVLVKIFQSFNVIELISGVSRVCSSWRTACCDPILWKTIDFGFMQSNYIKIPAPPYVWVAATSDKYLMRTIKVAFGLSRGNVRCLIFHIDLFLGDDHLSYIAERSPHLKRLVLPSWNRITKGGITEAVHKWPELESLTMPSIRDPPYILEEISTNCKNFTQLKIMGSFDVLFASTIIDFLPKLKVLSLRCSLLYKEAVDVILDNLEGLEALNISHCLFVEKSPDTGKRKLVWEVDKMIIQKASRLRRFFYCQDYSCALCERMKSDEGCLRWYKCEDGLWRRDEVMALAC